MQLKFEIIWIGQVIRFRNDIKCFKHYLSIYLSIYLSLCVYMYLSDYTFLNLGSYLCLFEGVYLFVFTTLPPRMWFHFLMKWRQM